MLLDKVDKLFLKHLHFQFAAHLVICIQGQVLLIKGSAGPISLFIWIDRYLVLCNTLFILKYHCCISIIYPEYYSFNNLENANNKEVNLEQQT